jgi:hypothetical protein
VAGLALKRTLPLGGKGFLSSYQTTSEHPYTDCACLEMGAPWRWSVTAGECWSLADCHLAPMIAYLTPAPEGEEAIARYTRSAWWKVVRGRKSLKDTDPGPQEMPSSTP